MYNNHRGDKMKKDRKNKINLKMEKSIWVGFGIICLFLYAFLNTNLAFQNDIFYSIKNGENLYRFGLDFVDHSSMFALNYQYPHYLFDLLTYFLYQIGGLLAIYIAEVVQFASLGGVFYRLLKKKTDQKFFSLFTTMIFMAFFYPFVSFRVQNLSFFLLLFEFYLLDAFVESKNQKFLYPLPILSFLLVQFHGAVFPFFLALFLPYFASDILHYYTKIKCKTEKNKKINLKLFLLIFLLCILTSLITPSGIESILYSIKIGLGNSMDYIREHQPSSLKDAPQIFALLFSFLTISLLFKVKYKTSDIFFFLGITLMFFLSLRHGSFFLLIVFPLLMIRIRESVNHEDKWKKQEEILLILTKKIFPILLLSMLVQASHHVKNVTIDAFVPENLYPVKIAEYIKENLNLNEISLFHGYQEGSYLLFLDIPVFIDSRCDLYLKEFNHEKDIFSDFLTLESTLNEELLKEYKITHILAAKNTTLYQLSLSKYSIIEEDEHYALFLTTKEKSSKSIE